MVSINVFVFSILGAAILGFITGRFIFFTKNGQLLTTLVKQRVVYAQNFKGGAVYKAMAAQVRKDGFTLVKNVRNIDKLKKEIAKELKIVPEALETVERTKGQFQIIDPNHENFQNQ